MIDKSFQEASFHDARILWLELAAMVHEHGESWLRSDEFREYFGNYERSILSVDALYSSLDSYDLAKLQKWHVNLLAEVGAIKPDVRNAYDALLKNGVLETPDQLDAFGALGRYVFLNLPIAKNKFFDFSFNDEVIDNHAQRVRELHETLDGYEKSGFISASMKSEVLADFLISDVGHLRPFLASIRDAYNPTKDIVRDNPLTEGEFLSMRALFNERGVRSRKETHLEVTQRFVERLEAIKRTIRDENGVRSVRPEPKQETIADIRVRQKQEKQARSVFWRIFAR